jgi:hypothetical protein
LGRYLIYDSPDKAKPLEGDGKRRVLKKMAELPKEGIFGVLGFFFESMSSRRRPANRTVESGIGALILLAIVIYTIMVLFAEYFKARQDIMIKTAEAQLNLCNAVFDNFSDVGKLDVRLDNSVYVYIAKRNYMMVAYPDRDRAITSVGEIWCNGKGVDRGLWPKVCLCDLQTGDELGSYRCITRSVSMK